MRARCEWARSKARTLAVVAAVLLAHTLSACIPVLDTTWGGWGVDDANDPQKHLPRCQLCCLKAFAQLALPALLAAGPRLEFLFDPLGGDTSS